jgi:hypothetical protein
VDRVSGGSRRRLWCAPGGAESLLVKVQPDRPQAGSVAEGGGNALLGAEGRKMWWP